MESLNAFIGKKEQPTPQEINTALGPAAEAWNQFIQSMAADLGVSSQEWKAIYVHKYGWSLKLKLKKRTIVHMGPCNGYFQVGFVLSDKALDAAKATRLPKNIQETLAEAPRYPEGNGVRLLVKKVADLPPIRKLAEIKLAN